VFAHNKLPILVVLFSSNYQHFKNGTVKVTTAQEKLVVRVSLGAAAAAAENLPAPATEQHWHWRRIAGAVLTLCAAALLLYGWLHVESPDTQPDVDSAAVLINSTDAFEAATPELVLEAVQQNSEPETEPAQAGTVIAEITTETTQVAALPLSSSAQVQESALMADPEAGAPLFSADTGVLRLALLTNEAPSASARSLGEQIDAAAVPQLALYSEVQGLNCQTIEHRWYYEGKLMTRITLPVKLDYWRTYSRKEFDANQKGEWRVEILDPQQNLLFSHHFHYQ
jgi:hypothetical protein